MISQTLKIADRVQEFGHLLHLDGRHLLSGQLHKICAELVLVFVNQVFFFLYFIVLILGIIAQQ